MGYALHARLVSARDDGLQGVRFVPPGTQIRLDKTGLTRTAHDVLYEWVHPDGLSKEDCLELARSSLVEQIGAVTPLCGTPSVGLSGGWDTRAVVSSLRAAGAPFRARVRGLPGLRVKEGGGLPPQDAAACKRSIALALRWQAGLMVTHKHETFLARKPSLDDGVVNVMGQHGEIGRGYYAKKIHVADVPEQEYENRLVAKLLARMPTFTRKPLRGRVREIVSDAYRQAARYGVGGLAALDFFYLYERTRRWASGSLSSQTGVVVAPFLNPGYIRASFAYAESKEENPFHRHIISTHTPDWGGVPFSDEAAVGNGAERPAWKRPQGNSNYSSAIYWKEVGKPIIDEALAEGGWWTEIFDPALTASLWPQAPDELAVASLVPEVQAPCVKESGFSHEGLATLETAARAR